MGDGGTNTSSPYDDSSSDDDESLSSESLSLSSESESEAEEEAEEAADDRRAVEFGEVERLRDGDLDGVW